MAPREAVQRSKVTTIRTRLEAIGLMGCFSIPHVHEAREPLGSPLSSISSTDSSNLFSNKPLELPEIPKSVNLRAHIPPGTLGGDAKASSGTGNTGSSQCRIHGGKVLSESLSFGRSRNIQVSENFSGPLTRSTSYDTTVDSPSFSGPLKPPSNSIYCNGEQRKIRALAKKEATLRRATSFGGRPQPLPLPVEEEVIIPKNLPVSLPLPSPDDLPSAASSPSREMRSQSATSAVVSTSRLAPPETIGSWSNWRGRVTPVQGGLPLPPPSVATKLLPSLEAYEFADLVCATREFASERCLEKCEFGTVYRAWIGDIKSEMTVVRLATAELEQDFKEWRSDVQMLAQLSSTNICKVKGYCTHEETMAKRGKHRERLLVFEQLPSGSLYDYLFGSSRETCPFFNWTARINVAFGVCRGLLYLHDRAPLQIVYRDLKSSNVLLDEDFNPKLAGHGLSVTHLTAENKSSFTTIVKISQALAKSNVWSFGVVLIELLTGKYSRDAVFLCDEKNFIEWGKLHMKDESRLSLIMDERLEGLYPIKGAMEVAMLALQCLRPKEAQRPNMTEVASTLKEIKHNYCGKVEIGQQDAMKATVTKSEAAQLATSSISSSNSEDESLLESLARLPMLPRDSMR